MKKFTGSWDHLVNTLVSAVFFGFVGQALSSIAHSSEALGIGIGFVFGGIVGITINEIREVSYYIRIKSKDEGN